MPLPRTLTQTPWNNMSELNYKIIRTARKTVAIQIKPDKTILVRAPKRMSKEQIHRLVQSKEKWIQKHLNELEKYSEVRRVFPEYDKWNDWLKTYGPDLMKRMTPRN